MKRIIFGALFMIFGCSSVTPADYAGKKPEITVQSFYDRPVHGYGFFQNRGGKITDRYYAYLIPTWTGNKGKIVEKQWNEEGKLFFEQEWDITVAEDGKSFSGVGSKIDGEIKGRADGYAMNMQYTLRVPRDNGKEISLSVDDWTYLQPDGSAINKISMSKFGFHAGDVIYTLRKLGKDEKLQEGFFPKD